MSIIDTLVFDRTQADVTQKTDKGYYNASDLNRVQEAMSYLSGVLAESGITVTLHQSKVWSDEDIPNVTDMDAYLDDVRAIRSAISVFADTPSAPESMRYLTYSKANDIEKILVDVEAAIKETKRCYIRAGMPWAYAGTEVYVRND